MKNRRFSLYGCSLMFHSNSIVYCLLLPSLKEHLGFVFGCLKYVSTLRKKPIDYMNFYFITLKTNRSGI